MKKIFTFPNIYTLVALLYLCLGDLLNNISIITMSVHGLFLALTLVLLFLSFKECRMNVAMKSLCALSAMILIYGVWLIYMVSDYSLLFDSPTRYLDLHFKSIAPIFVYYYFAEKKLIDVKWFCYATPFFLFAVYQQYIFAQRDIILKYDFELGEFTDNSGYFFLALLPIAAFFKERRWLEYLIITFLTIMIVSCMKRGPIICAGIIDVFMLKESLSGSKGKFKTLIFALLAFCGIYLFVKNIYLSNDYFSYRFEQTLDGDDSNRSKIYNRLWQYYQYQTNPLSYIFGNGAYSCARYLGFHAHNDWLEMLMSLGFVGVILYAKYWKAQVKTIIKAKANGTEHSIVTVFISIVICNFMKTIFSMSIDDMLIYSSSMLGFCLSKCNEWNDKPRLKE